MVRTCAVGINRAKTPKRAAKMNTPTLNAKTRNTLKIGLPVRSRGMCHLKPCNASKSKAINRREGET